MEKKNIRIKKLRKNCVQYKQIRKSGELYTICANVSIIL